MGSSMFIFPKCWREILKKCLFNCHHEASKDSLADAFSKDLSFYSLVWWFPKSPTTIHTCFFYGNKSCRNKNHLQKQLKNIEVKKKFVRRSSFNVNPWIHREMFWSWKTYCHLFRQMCLVWWVKLMKKLSLHGTDISPIKVLLKMSLLCPFCGIRNRSQERKQLLFRNTHRKLNMESQYCKWFL